MKRLHNCERRAPATQCIRAKACCNYTDLVDAIRSSECPQALALFFVQQVHPQCLCLLLFFSVKQRKKRRARAVIRKSVNPQQDMITWASRPSSFFLKERASPYGWRTWGGGSRGVNPELPLGTSLLFSFHYESNLPTILPNNFGITAYLLCVASAHRLHFVVLTEGGNNHFTHGEIKFSTKAFSPL